MPKQPHSMTTADFCRRQGWRPGTCLHGIEGRPDGVCEDTIRINALGISSILATAIARHGAPILPKHQHEHTWTLTCRDWQEVPDPEKPEMIDWLYGLEYDDGELTATGPDEVLERVIDDMWKLGDTIDDTLDRIDWPVRVFTYRRIVPTEKDIERFTEATLDYAHNYLEEDYCRVYDDPPEPTPAMHVAAVEFAQAMVRWYVPTLCEQTGEVTEFTREQAKELTHE